MRSRRKEHRDSSSSVDGSSIGSSCSNSVSNNGDGDARGKQSNTCASSQHDEIGSIKNNGSKNDGSSSAATTHHVVSSEDNFNSLSILYDMSISDIKRLNRLFGKSQQWCFCWLGLFLCRIEWGTTNDSSKNYCGLLLVACGLLFARTPPTLGQNNLPPKGTKLVVTPGSRTKLRAKQQVPQQVPQEKATTHNSPVDPALQVRAWDE